MDIVDIHKIVDIAKTLNPQIQVLVCAESKEEAEVIRREAIGEVYFAKEEMAKAVYLGLLQLNEGTKKG